jgi:hypothetical protein
MPMANQTQRLLEFIFKTLKSWLHCSTSAQFIRGQRMPFSGHGNCVLLGHAIFLSLPILADLMATVGNNKCHVDWMSLRNARPGEITATQNDT